MKKTFLVHGTWLVIAVAAFVVGYQRVPDQRPSDGNPVSMLPTFSGKDRSLVGPPEANAREVGKPQANSQQMLVLSEQDIKALGETFRKAASPIERRLAFSKMLAGLTVENALLVREQIAHMDHRSAEFRDFHYAWGAVGGKDAALFGASTKEDDMAPVLAGWANADPDAALAWFDSLQMKDNPAFDYLLNERKIDPNGLRQHLMRGLVQGLADKDPKAASEVVMGMVESGNKAANEMMHTVAEAMLKTDKPSNVVSWAESLPEGHARNIALHRVADRFVDENPEAAAAWATHYADQPEGKGVIGEVGVNWSHRDPEAALAWLSQLPQSHGQNNGVHRALHDWTHRDPTAASAYLTSMPASSAKDAAITGFSSRIAWEDPQAAIAWAQTIASDGQRDQTMITVGRAWARKDATAATEWAAHAGLPAKVQQAILNPAPDKRGRR